ncbi:MAG TPA: CAP domain-containing protein [Solirubrobacteraceae bacterium]|jgi:uncharacterized protein YkwD
MLRLRLTALPTLFATVVAMVMIAAAPAAAEARCKGAKRMPSAGHAKQVRRAVLCLLNRERANHGLRPLRSNRRLRHAAARHSASMSRHNFFDHTSPTGSTMTTRVKGTGYTRFARRWSIGENIAWGSGGLATPRRIVSAWMHSPGHRANILNGGFREIGIGVALGTPVRLSAASRGATYTTDFGRRS